MPAIKQILVVAAVIAFISTYIVLNYFLTKLPQSHVHLQFTPLSPNSRPDIGTNLLQKNDYNSNLNINFNFMILNPICTTHTEMRPFLLMLVHSSCDNFDRRQIIRNTWGASSNIVGVAFLVAKSLDSAVNSKVKREAFRHKDVIQGDFIESYLNVTYKHTMGMKYFIYHCPKARYVLKVDDDIVVNTPKLVDFLHDKISYYGARKMILCDTVHHARALKSSRAKWRISFEGYPHKHYPTYCQGKAIIYSPDVVLSLYKQAQLDKSYFSLDDVFYTGIMAEKIGFRGHSNIGHLMNFDFKAGGLPENYRSHLFIGSDLTSTEILKLWILLRKYDSLPELLHYY